MTVSIKPLPKDADRQVIQAGSSVYVFNVSALASAWTAITLPVCSKCITIKTRDNVNFKLSHEEGGDYITVSESLAIQIVANANETVFYVQPASDTTMEILIVR